MIASATPADVPIVHCAGERPRFVICVSCYLAWPNRPSGA
jgi:hypothetical protein